MKKSALFLVVIVGIMVLFYFILVIQPYSFLRIIKGKKGYASYLIQKVGTEEINQEAERMFDEFHKQSLNLYSPRNPSEYPLISKFAFATIFAVSKAKKDMREHITIKYGSHQMADFLYVFDKRTPLPYFNASQYRNLWKITNNIYLAQ